MTHSHLTAGERELLALAEKATPGPWELGGPHPGTSVIFMIDPGRGWPDPEPPVYEAVAVLDQRIEGEPDARARADAAFIAACRTAVPQLGSRLEGALALIDNVFSAGQGALDLYRAEAARLLEGAPERVGR